MQNTTVYILCTAMSYTYLRRTWLFIKIEFIIRVLKSLIISHQILKILLAIARDLKEF